MEPHRQGLTRWSFRIGSHPVSPGLAASWYQLRLWAQQGPLQAQLSRRGGGPRQEAQ
jgi:hypothetical protein